MNPEKHPLQFKTPDLQTSQEVQESVERQERLNKRILDEARELEQETGELIDPELFKIKIPNNPTERINVYMDRMEKIFLNPDERIRKRNLKFLKPYIYDEFIIKPEEVPESYFELQQRVARDQGIEAQHIPEATRKEMIDTIIKDQKHSFDNWIDYLTSEDATYPTWFKYFVFQNITKLSQFDKALGKFKDRTDTTVAPYPDVYREPLAQICDMYEQVAQDNKVLKTDPNIQAQFSKSFPKLYAELITQSLQSSMENKEEIKGEWVKYSQGDKQDAERLYKSLEGKGTGWCTAGRSTADTQIQSGDFYVYYTYNAQGEPVQPRIAIRMNGTSTIGEVRGILQHQALEPQMNDILEDKLATFGSEADKYKKKSEDMKRMTEIEHKINKGETLTKSELEFLYEINTTIEGFGYQKDPRVKEIRDKRNIKEDIKTVYGYDLLNPNKEALEFIYTVGKTPTPQVFLEYVTKLRKDRNVQEDAPIIFECTREQIATNKDEVNKNTKAYIGPWNPTTYQIIKQYSNITHLYESFPDKKIFTFELKTDSTIQTPEQAKSKLEEKGIYISEYGKDLLDKTEFSKEQHQYKLVQFTVEQLGLTQGATTEQIYTKAQELGLKLCPAEVGPQLRIVYEGKDWKLIAMKQITDRDGSPFVFDLISGGAGLHLRGRSARSDYGWGSGSQFVFLTS